MIEKGNTKQLNIRGIDSSVKRQFEQLKDEKHFKSHSELLVELLNHYVLNEKLFNSQEQTTFYNALSIKNISPQELVKMAVIPFCNRIIKNNKLGKLEHKNTLESNNRLDEVVKNIMSDNDKAKLKDDKIYIILSELFIISSSIISNSINPYQIVSNLFINGILK